MRDLGSSFPSVRATVVHIYSSEWVWYSRWQGTSPAAHLTPDAFPDVPALRMAWAGHERKVRAFVETLDGDALGRPIAYTLFDGQTSSTVLRHMIQHVVNHASYHRGQVTTMLRQLGAAPPKSMDMIAFYRRKGAGPREGRAT